VPQVAVTIKPVYSLVAGLMAGVGEPELIISNNASPHHYSLRPSERRLIARADLVIWVSPALESFMPRVIDSMQQDNTLRLIDASAIERLPARSTHQQHNAEPHSSTQIMDPHIWLSPANARAIIDAVSQELSKLDPANQQHYTNNRDALLERISTTDVKIKSLLAGKTAPFLSYHDAYQYFEKAFGLNSAGFVSSGAEISPSARQVHKLREKIKRENIHCLLYEAPYRPALADTLTHDLDIATIEVDAIGIRLSANEDTWFDLMIRVAEAYATCLSY
jgi:zinc transport system substrate-binding protein